METLEKMDDFFTERVESYDDHMLETVPGCREGYLKMAELLPDGCSSLLDLGCGTGLELDAIFRRFPSLSVTGIDLTKAMLEKLKTKYPDKSLQLVCGSYFDVPFGENAFDCAISFQTMHHFSHEKKTGLYRRILNALRPGGYYIECDYMVEEQQEEDFYFAENARIRIEMQIPEDAFYHYDTPCTIENQKAMLLHAGFSDVRNVFRIENTTILVAAKAYI